MQTSINHRPYRATETADTFYVDNESSHDGQGCRSAA